MRKISENSDRDASLRISFGEAQLREIRSGMNSQRSRSHNKSYAADSFQNGNYKTFFAKNNFNWIDQSSFVNHNSHRDMSNAKDSPNRERKKKEDNNEGKHAKNSTSPR